MTEAQEAIRSCLWANFVPTKLNERELPTYLVLQVLHGVLRRFHKGCSLLLSRHVATERCLDLRRRFAKLCQPEGKGTFKSTSIDNREIDTALPLSTGRKRDSESRAFYAVSLKVLPPPSPPSARKCFEGIYF